MKLEKGQFWRRITDPSRVYKILRLLSCEAYVRAVGPDGDKSTGYVNRLALTNHYTQITKEELDAILAAHKEGEEQ